MAHNDGLQHFKFIKLKVVLLEHREAFARRNVDLAVRGLDFARENFKKRRFSRAVRADEAVAVARGEFYVYVAEKHAAAKAERKVRCTNHTGYLPSFVYDLYH